ncbi:DUF4836 family protein [Bacteroides sp. 519]|uniref:DUF4836 family protein n=1 Tax=Bacteroides sp. 519 TaxID=2302937 RepID=UPI0013D8A8F5|nr:DUF4836 family protein [Bacteroides sp. 519]NDV58751.1 DUF4836 family protein [Bacteroides sp. 519]
MKMKKINQLVLSAVLLVMTSACSKTAGDYTQVIPADANTVIALDLNAMTNKAGLNDKENQALQQKMIETMTSGLKPATVAQIEKIMKSPEESGFAVKSPVYMFTTPASTDPMVVMKVADAKKVQEFLNFMVEEKISEGIVDKSGYKFMESNGGFIAYNDAAAIVGNVNRNFQENNIATFLKAKTEESIQSNTYFQKLQSKKGDVLFFTSLEAYSDEIVRQMRQMGTTLPENINPKDFNIVGDFSFEKGKLVSHIEFVTQNEELNKQIKNSNKSMGKVKANFMGDFPAAPLFFGTFNVNGGELYKMLMENPEFSKSMEEDSEAAAVAKELVEAFNGDVSLALLNVTMADMPTFVAYADTKKDDALDVIYKNKDKFNSSRESLVELAPHQYQYKSREFNFYFGVKDNRMYMTNDEKVYKGTTNYTQTLKDARYSSSIKGKTMYMVLDIDAILALPVVQMMASFGGQEYKTYIDIFSKFSYLEFSSTDSQKVEVSLYTTDKDTNALKQIVDTVKEYSGM